MGYLGGSSALGQTLLISAGLIYESVVSWRLSDSILNEVSFTYFHNNIVQYYLWVWLKYMLKYVDLLCGAESSGILSCF